MEQSDRLDRQTPEPPSRSDVDPAELQLYLRLTTQREQRLRRLRRRRWVFGGLSVLLAATVLAGYVRLNPVRRSHGAGTPTSRVQAEAVGMASAATTVTEPPRPATTTTTPTSV